MWEASSNPNPEFNVLERVEQNEEKLLQEWCKFPVNPSQDNSELPGILYTDGIILPGNGSRYAVST